jgi:hypothetical protein
LEVEYEALEVEYELSNEYDPSQASQAKSAAIALLDTQFIETLCFLQQAELALSLAGTLL